MAAHYSLLAYFAAVGAVTFTVTVLLHTPLEGLGLGTIAGALAAALGMRHAIDSGQDMEAIESWRQVYELGAVLAFVALVLLLVRSIYVTRGKRAK
jgi:uncharacterized membrane protein